MSDKKFELTRRRVLTGLSTIGIAGAVGGAGTMAYFSEEKNSNNNTIAAGSIDLETNNNESPSTSINVGPVAPGQSGTASFNVNNVGSVDGFLSLEFGDPEPRNDFTEVLQVTVKVDGTVIRNGTFGSVFDGEGEWSNADIPLGASSTRTLAVEWAFPGGAGNDTQGQKAKGDLTLHLNQNEEAFADIVVDGTGNGDTTSIQTAVDMVPSDAVVLVRNGTYDEAVTIDKAGQTLASKNGAGNTKIKASAATDDNRAIEIDGVDGVTVDGFNVTFDADASSNSEKYAIRARATSNDLTVRNCEIGRFSTEDQSTNSGAVRATGVTVTSNQGPNAGGTVSDPIIENNDFVGISCTGSVDSSNTDSDSKAKGLALNGDVRNASVNNNDFLGIGTTSNDPSGAQDALNGNSAEGTSKPRGISLIKGGASTAPKSFTIIENTFGGTGSDAIEGTYGQPSIFFGGSGALGEEEVYNNVFYHPIDNLRGGALKLRDNEWKNNGGYPTLEPADSDVDGGNLIDRAGGANYDTTFTI